MIDTGSNKVIKSFRFSSDLTSFIYSVCVICIREIYLVLAKIRRAFLVALLQNFSRTSINSRSTIVVMDLK